MDEDVSLVGLTEDMQVNGVLIGFIGLCQMLFPRRIHSAYLLGSHAKSEAVTDSDLDLTLVFKERFLEGEAERFERFRQSVFMLSRIPLDLRAVDEVGLPVDGGPNLKHASMLLMGEDARDRITVIPEERWLRICMHKPFVFIERARARAEGEPLRFPLGHPDPNGAFYGYDYREVQDAQGQLHRGFKELINTANAIAMATTALKGGRRTYSKRDAIEAHREAVNDAWTPLFADVFACRERWGYRVPDAPADQAHLRSLCERMRDAENHFLGLYKDYLLAELRRGEVADRVLAARRLGETVFPGEEVAAALKGLETAPEPELREAASASLRVLEKYGAVGRQPAA